MTWQKRRGDDLPELIGAGDLALISLATQRTSRTISKDKVTEPFRAPFVVPEGTGDGAPGEIASLMAVVGLADFLQIAYRAASDMMES